MFVKKRFDVGRNRVSWTQNPDKYNLSADFEELSHSFDGWSFDREIQCHNSSGMGGFIILGESIKKTNLKNLRDSLNQFMKEKSG